MDRRILYAVLAQNGIVMICWTIIAVVFEKWWLALFAALMMTGVRDGAKSYFRYCDKCGKRGPYADNEEDAIRKAKEAGWIIRQIDGKWDDRCPDCQEGI